MIVHFIGGPRDGEREAISSIVGGEIQIPHITGPVEMVREEFDLPPISSSYDIATYKVLRRERYIIAEYVEPKVATRWSVGLRVVDRFNYDTLAAFRRWMLERETGVGDVRCVAAQVAFEEEATLDFLVTVEGPADPDAIRLAAEKLSEWLHREVPAGVIVVSTQAAAD